MARAGIYLCDPSASPASGETFEVWESKNEWFARFRDIPLSDPRNVALTIYRSKRAAIEAAHRIWKGDC